MQQAFGIAFSLLPHQFYRVVCPGLCMFGSVNALRSVVSRKTTADLRGECAHSARTGDPLNPIHYLGVLVGSAELGSVP